MGLGLDLGLDLGLGLWFVDVDLDLDLYEEGVLQAQASGFGFVNHPTFDQQERYPLRIPTNTGNTEGIILCSL